MSDGWSPKQRTAIFAAANARDLSHDDLREIARDRFGVTGLSKLSRDQAHQLLDVLNGKDPEKESRKRRWLYGPVKRGERKPSHPPAKPQRDGADGPGASAPDSGAEGDGKVLRPASDEQWGLLRLVARRVGLTKTSRTGDGTFVLDMDALARWMRWKFHACWKVVGVGPGQRHVMVGSLARKTVYALRDWENRRLRKWEAAHGRDVANAVLEAGLPSEWDKKLPVEIAAFPAPVRAELARGQEA